MYPVGLLSYSREKRASFEMVKLLYNGEKTNALPIGRYRASFPCCSHRVGIRRSSLSMAYLYHYNRRFNETFKRSLIRSYNFYSDLRDVRTVSIPQTFILAASVAVTLASYDVRHSLSLSAQSCSADYLLTTFVVSDRLKE